MITSKDNKKIKNVIALLEKAKERKKQDAFVVEGSKMFLEAPGEWIKEIYISENYGKSKSGFQPDEESLQELVISKVEDLKNTNNIFIETVSDEVFQKMSDTKTPQGILCVLTKPGYQEEDLYKINQEELFLILEDIQDPGNLGTMLRAGEGAGVTGVIMSRNTVDVFNPKTIRATMGSIYRVPFYYVDDLENCARELVKKGVRTYAAHLKGEVSYDKFNYHKSSAFMIGNEGNGLSDELASLAETYVKIPMLGKVESLNAAVAATLLVYEAARQRRD